MTNGIDHHDGDPVTPDRIPAALTAGEFRYDDGATQTFSPSGTTTYVEGGRPTNGEWYVDDDGHFWSFWPPTERTRYELTWLVEDGRFSGLRFNGVSNDQTFVGRYHELSGQAEDLAILEQLNLDYIHSDETSDAKRFSEFLSEDFITQTPGVTRNRDEYLDYIAKPRPIKDITLEDVKIRILSDVALIHGAVTYTMIAGGERQDALYTDIYQKREGTWLCVAACAIAPGT